MYKNISPFPYLQYISVQSYISARSILGCVLLMDTDQHCPAIAVKIYERDMKYFVPKL